MSEYNPNCGKCGMLNSRGFCSLTACRYPANVIAVQPARVSFIPKPTSWGDKIRAMSDEELAEKIIEAYGVGGICPINHTHLFCLLDNGCVKCWLDWLKSPVEVDK